MTEQGVRTSDLSAELDKGRGRARSRQDVSAHPPEWLLLWPLSADKAAHAYIQVMLPMCFLAVAGTPFLLLALLIEAIVRREPRKA